jgi:very-short-patch-repair endonuclease
VCGGIAPDGLGGMDLWTFGSPDLAVPLGASNRRWPRRRVAPRHIIEAEHLRTTDELQTLVDLAAVVTDAEWEWALEWMLRKKHTTVEALESLLVLAPRKDRASADRVRRVLDLRPIGVPPTDSVLETRFIQLCRRFDIPEPTRQHRVDISRTVRYYLDCSWPELGVFLELDGKGHDDQPVYDAHRQTLVTAKTGWLCGRLTWRDVVHTPKMTSKSVKALLAEGAANQTARAGGNL